MNREYIDSKLAQVVEFSTRVKENPLKFPSTIRAMVARLEKIYQGKSISFNETEGLKPCYFLENLVQTEDRFNGKKITLQPWQVYFIAMLYGTYQGERRLFNKALLVIPRKNGKSTLASGLALYHLYTDRGAEAYLCAQDKSQASIVFNQAKNFIMSTPKLDDTFRSMQYHIELYNKAGFLKPLHAEAERLRGLNPSFICYDEFFDTKNDDLFQTLENARGARTEDMFLIIGSHTSLINGFAFSFEKSIKSTPPADTLLMIWEPDATDDLADPKTWEKVNPNYGVTISPEKIQSQFETARLSASLLSQWQNFCLNKWTATSSGWLDSKAVGAVLRDFSPDELTGSNVVIGFDLSAIHDLTSFSILHFNKGQNPRVTFRNFIPGDTLHTRLKLENPMYLEWIDRGLVTVIPGNVVDYEQVFGAVKEEIDTKNLTVVSASHDAWRARDLVKLFNDAGVETVAINQGFQGIGLGLQELEEAIIKQEIEIENNPVFLWALGNVELLADKNGNRKPIKPQVGRDRTRIDPILALIMAFYRYKALQLNPKNIDFGAFGDDLFLN
jgi:phage terminase large subunit-like protein